MLARRGTGPAVSFAVKPAGLSVKAGQGDVAVAYRNGEGGNVEGAVNRVDTLTAV
jgi:hypothetical protein